MGQLPLIVPQVKVPVPQPLPVVPQFLPAGQEESGLQHVFGAGPDADSQTWGDVQGPQLVTVRDAPQLSVPVIEPHVACKAVQSAESDSACRAAPMIICAKRSMRRACLCSMYWSGSKSFTSQAKVIG